MTLHGIGIDVGSVSRVAALMDRYGEPFMARWFDASELGDLQCGPVRVASRFAAKEAVWKALRIDERTPVPWRQIVITGDSSSTRLTVRLGGELAYTAEAMRIGKIFATTTVSGDIAVAVALAEKAEQAEPQ